MPEPDSDVLTYARSLEEAGLSREQANAIAQGNSSMLAARFDSLATREYLEPVFARIDARFDQVDTRLSQVDTRLSQVDARLDQVDIRLGQMDIRLDQVDARLDQVDRRFQQVERLLDLFDKRFERLEDRIEPLAALRGQVNLHTWMLGLIVIVLVVPQLQAWFATA